MICVSRRGAEAQRKNKTLLVSAPPRLRVSQFQFACFLFTDSQTIKKHSKRIAKIIHNQSTVVD
jgi:hypothetical protein